MRTIKCARCGRIIQASGGVTMCPACRSAAKGDGHMGQRQCRQCGIVFLGGPRAWYCPECRAERVRAQDGSYKARARAGTVRKIGSTDLCQVCGKPYTVEGSLQKYCPDCAPAAVTDAYREGKRAAALVYKPRKDARRAELKQSRRVCVVCGKAFYGPQPTVTCSPACADIRRQQWQRAADAKRRTYTIYFGDGSEAVMLYTELCSMLGVTPEAHLVRVTPKGTIAIHKEHSAGAAKSLLDACRKAGLKPSRSLIEATAK